jgi:hypothetical protein
METKTNITKASHNVEATWSEGELQLPKNAGCNKVLRTLACKLLFPIINYSTRIVLW